MIQTTQDADVSKTNLSPETFKPLLAKLISSPQTFSRSDAVLAMEHLLDPTSTMPSQIGSFLTALHISGMESHSEVLVGASTVLRKHAVPVPTEERVGVSRVVDIVGTGGDGHNTFNVSTTAAVVAAGAGARVLKVHIFFLASMPDTFSAFLIFCGFSTAIGRPLLPRVPQTSSWRWDAHYHLHHQPQPPLLPLQTFVSFLRHTTTHPSRHWHPFVARFLTGPSSIS